MRAEAPVTPGRRAQRGAGRGFPPRVASRRLASPLLCVRRAHVHEHTCAHEGDRPPGAGRGSPGRSHRVPRVARAGRAASARTRTYAWSRALAHAGTGRPDPAVTAAVSQPRSQLRSQSRRLRRAQGPPLRTGGRAVVTHSFLPGREGADRAAHGTDRGALPPRPREGVSDHRGASEFFFTAPAALRSGPRARACRARARSPPRGASPPGLRFTSSAPQRTRNGSDFSRDSRGDLCREVVSAPDPLDQACDVRLSSPPGTGGASRRASCEARCRAS